MLFVESRGIEGRLKVETGGAAPSSDLYTAGISGRFQKPRMVICAAFEITSEDAWMDRREQLLKHITKWQKGIEIGPWFAPLAAKREGYNCLSLDVFETETLKKNAEGDPFVDNSQISSIETVDIVASSTEIYDVIAARGELSTFDYIISSHNFEHLSNPIKFLQGCEKVLKLGGYLSMAVPDKRSCFDYFRPTSTLGSWLEAYTSNCVHPTAVQGFEQASFNCKYSDNDEDCSSFPLTKDPNKINSQINIKNVFDIYMQRKDTKDVKYYDTHCWTFTPSSFYLIILDVMFLKLVNFDVEEITENNGNEFYVHLRRVESRWFDDSEFYAKRESLLRSAIDEVAYNSPYAYNLRAQLENSRLELVRLQAENKSIKSSLAWKIGSPLQRLWTRRERRARRLGRLL
jgi:predicted SAM-dependent methyltransferase